MHRGLASAILCSALVWASGTKAQGQHPAHTWDYGEEHGPSHWGELEPDFTACKDGHHQSPIDIRNATKADLPPIHFDYKTSPLHIIDNGHTIMVDYAPGSFISVGDKKYELKQFHFHRPSEEKINGKTYEMTLHLVHANQEGKLAVVAVVLGKGQDNRLIHQLWEHIPKDKDKEYRLDSIQIDAADLLPADRGYFTFQGSLTTPPCTEGVTWFVLQHPVSVSADEIAGFSKIYQNNARPTQPVYGRAVMASK